MKKKKRSRIISAAAALLLLCGCTNKIEYPEGVDTLPTYSATGSVLTVYDTSEHTLSEDTTTTVTTVTTVSETTVPETEAPEETETTSVCETVSTGDGLLAIEDVPEVGLSEYYDNTQTMPTFTTTQPRPETLYSSDGSTVYSASAATETPPVTLDSRSETSASSVSQSADVSASGLDIRLTDGRKSNYTNKSVISHPYSYYTLSQKNKNLYDKLVNAMLNYEDHVDFTSAEAYTFDDLFNSYQLIYNDENRLFYISSTLEYVTDEDNYVKLLNISYLYDTDEIKKMQKEIDDEADKILSQITPQMNDYDIVKLIHDYIIVNCTYDENAQRPNNVYGALVDKRALCQAYSQSFTYLCSLCGIDSLIILGVANEPHMWNLVKLDGDYYHIDLTWDDPDRAQNPDSIRYDYFCLTDERIRQLRQVDDYDYEVPKADGTKYQYYYYNNLVAANLAEARKILEEEIIKASKTKSSTVQFLCADDKAFKEITEVLFGTSSDNIIGILSSVKDRAAVKFNTESVYHNSNSNTRTVKIFIDYLD